jgi:hypothetical protein
MDDYGNDLIIVMDWFDYLWGYLPQISPSNPEIY